MDLLRRLSVGALLAPLARPVTGAGPTAESSAGGSGPVAAAMGRHRGRLRRHPATTVPPQPVVLGGARVVQVDGASCGSTVLLMLAATGDPVLARWLEIGELPAGLLPHRMPPEIPREDGTGLAVAPGLRTAVDRLAAAQRHVHRRTSARALCLLPWPAALGTPPWPAAREARFPGVRYHHLPIDDTAPAAASLLAAVHTATLAGTPVPLYTGGDLAHGLTSAPPRHVVLAVPPPDGAPHRGHDTSGNPVLHLFEPSGGRVHQVPVADLLGRSDPHPALGGWPHVCWVLLPRTGAGSPSVAPATGGRHAGQVP